MDDFTDKVVMITGAPGAVGSAVTRAFAARGAKLALVNHTLEPLQAAFDDLPNALLLGDVDVTEAESVQRGVKQVMDGWGRIDVLVNTVGTWRGGQSLYDESALDTWDFLMTLNARSIIVMAQAVVPVMIAQGSGKIVSIGARGGLQGSGSSGAYSASKAALIRATESLSESLKNQGINVNAVLPSTIDTAANRQSMPKADPDKWVAPDALADVIVFLASDAARAIHGASIPVYGRV